MYYLQLQDQPGSRAPTVTASTGVGLHTEASLYATPSYHITRAAAGSPAAEAAARNPHIVYPNAPMAASTSQQHSAGRRVKRIAVRGRVTPAPAGQAPGSALTSLPSGPAEAAGSPPTPSRSPIPGVATAAAIAAVSAQSGAGSVPQLVEVADTLLPSAFARAVAALTGGLRDWVWHGSQQKPKHLYLPLRQM